MTRPTPALLCLVVLCLVGLSSPQRTLALTLRPATLPTASLANVRHLTAYVCFEQTLPPTSGSEADQPDPPPEATNCGEPLSFKLSPEGLTRHRLGFEVKEIFPLGDPAEERPQGEGDAFDLCYQLKTSCCLESRPDGNGFQLSLAYPARHGTCFSVGMQAEDGGHVGRPAMRTLVGLSLSF